MKSPNKLKNTIKKVLIETKEDIDTEKDKKYVDEMIKLHGDYRTVRRKILTNLVNSEFSRSSNSFVDKVWAELHSRFPS